MKLSPMMEQYMSIKSDYEDCILFFRLGDFYEMFFEDAKRVSRLLELTLTGRNCGLEEKAPMCGVPFHSADSYIERLVGMGYKVAICEQLEDPAETKGMVERGVVRIVTPGTVTSQSSIKEDENNFLASCYMDNEGMAVAYCDLSTGQLCATEKTSGSGIAEDMLNELVKISPAEILVNEKLTEIISLEDIGDITGAFVQTTSGTKSSKKASEEAISAQFGGVPVSALGINGKELAIIAVGTLLDYLHETQKQELHQITSCRYYETGGHMSLDKATIRNLEITETLYDHKTEGSLLWVLDKTGTAMGGRKLRQWIKEPLNKPQEINDRLDAVEELAGDQLLLNDIREALKSIYDFERLAGRMASGNANGRDMIALASSISRLPDVKTPLGGAESSLLRELSRQIGDLQDLEDSIRKAIVPEPPFTIKEGGLINTGFSEELDMLKDSISDAKAWISGLENIEKERTGITHLKVGYNKVFGYYIEVSNSNLNMVPEDYIRKQTLVGGERFITPELKDKEGLVLNAETKINKLEYEIFTELRRQIEARIVEIQSTSDAVSAIDVLCSFAKVSSESGYVKPKIDDSMELAIEKGRHPVVEKTTAEGLFVANDTYLDDKDASMLVITGPNMAGKSTYMRQTALIVLMAQIGCFVPAEAAHIGVCDRIFTRIGASDNLAKGHSTFYVEMSELAYILRNAEKRSLIILDEIGRGTSTYDGLSIAWACAEYLCSEKRKIRTLFATHYHEMTALADELEGVKNLNVEVLSEGGNIVFLHKIVEGSASRSYGVHVARLAGVPEQLLMNAEDKLDRLETEDKAVGVTGAFSSSANRPDAQISFFDQPENPAVTMLKELDLMNVTPSQAIKILEDLKELIDDKSS